MPLQLQSKLLRVLQEQEFEPVGSNQVKSVDVRVIAATSVDLQRKVEEGQFRADLFYRLNVLAIRVPPLRERAADMEALCENILEQIEQRTGLAHRELTPEAIECLRQCAWRGNVRELHNVLEKVLMHSDKARIAASDLEGIVPARALKAPDAISMDDIPVPGSVRPYADELEAFERRVLANALKASDDRVEEAAKQLGLARATLYRKLHNLGMVSQ